MPMNEWSWPGLVAVDVAEETRGSGAAVLAGAELAVVLDRLVAAAAAEDD